VYTTKPVLPKKHRLKEEGEEEEPDRKRVKTEMAETVEGKLESHPQVHKKWTCSSNRMVAVFVVCSFDLVSVLFYLPHVLYTGGEETRGTLV